LSVQFAMVMSPSSTRATAQIAAVAGELPSLPRVVAGGEGELDEKVRADLAGLVISGPGLREGWLADMRREGLLGKLVGSGVSGEAVASAGHGHRLDRRLTAEVTALCVIVGCLFPGQGYDLILKKVFGLPGLIFKPGTRVPSGPALPKARKLPGEQVMRRIFERDAARADAGRGAGSTAFGMERTAFDGTTAEVFSTDDLADAFGVPAGGTKAKIRLVAHLPVGSRRWKAAAIGGYHDGENTLADELAGSRSAGMLNLADRGFFSMDRWLRFSGTGARLIWRVKNGARSVPFRTIKVLADKVLADGSELVLLRESGTMWSKRRRDAGDQTLPPLPDTIARLVQLTVLTRTARGKTKTTTVRLLTTLLDPGAFPAGQIAALYAQRREIETACLHLTKTLRGTRRTLRGRPAEPARQEAWAFLLVHNMIATVAAQAAALAGTDPDAISFTAVLSLVRTHAITDACCTRCRRRC
jgi:Insertion element 4 transposase N-terminal